MRLTLERMPPSLVVSLAMLGIPTWAMPDVIREVARTTDDSIASHHECGYLRGLLAAKKCQQGHDYTDAQAPNERILECWEVVRRAEEGKSDPRS